MFGPTAATARLQDKASGPAAAAVLSRRSSSTARSFGARRCIDGFTRAGQVLRLRRHLAHAVATVRGHVGRARAARSGAHRERAARGARGRRACRRSSSARRRRSPACAPTFLDEDYLAFVVPQQDEAPNADAVLEQHGDDIAQLLRGERQALSRQERDEVLRHRLSYLTDDLVVPAWNAAFVLDSEAGAPGDARDPRVRQLAAARVPLPRRSARNRAGADVRRARSGRARSDGVVGRRYTRAARRLQSRRSSTSTS